MKFIQRYNAYFYIYLVRKLVSLIGIWMSTFALDIWVFQQTGSATQFALVTLTNTLTFHGMWKRRFLPFLKP